MGRAHQFYIEAIIKMGFFFNRFHNNDLSVCGLYQKNVVTKQSPIQPNYRIKE